MRTLNSISIIGGAAVATLLLAAQAQAIVAYNYTGVVGNESTQGPWVFGNVFNVNSAINVTAVGAFEDGGSLPAGVTVPVAIYNYNGATWNQVSGTYQTFSSASPGKLTDTMGFKDVTAPVTLSPGTYAIVAANYGPGQAQGYDASYETSGALPSFNDGSGAITMGNAGTGDPWATVFVAGGFGDSSGASLSDPLTGMYFGNWGDPTPGLAGGTFDFTPVPEAATFGAAGVGLLGLVYIGRYARLRRRIKLA